jgi:hypothetical protein
MANTKVKFLGVKIFSTRLSSSSAQIVLTTLVCNLKTLLPYEEFPQNIIP